MILWFYCISRGRNLTSTRRDTNSSPTHLIQFLLIAISSPGIPAHLIAISSTFCSSTSHRHRVFAHLHLIVFKFWLIDFSSSSTFCSSSSHRFSLFTHRLLIVIDFFLIDRSSHLISSSSTFSLIEYSSSSTFSSSHLHPVAHLISDCTPNLLEFLKNSLMLSRALPFSNWNVPFCSKRKRA